jgi:predicted transcriptional regulator
MAKMLTEMPMSIRIKRRTADRLSELQNKSGLKRADIIRLALDQFLEANPSVEAVIRAAIKARAVT